jgi:hypothetical protein
MEARPPLRGVGEAGAEQTGDTLLHLARVVVVGTTGAGKTTFARRLALMLGAEHVELDALYWGPGWTPRDAFVPDVTAAARQPRWVIDGNYAAVRDVVWSRCTAIVWLDYSLARVLGRVVWRTARRIVTRERLYGGNRETVGGALLDPGGAPWHALRTHPIRRRRFPRLFRRPGYRHAVVIQLRTPAAARRFLEELGARE